ncbi:MAG: TonB-dependent receptor [Caulobacter sp.]|nr:TonB-dependent receptor [Caulobacter sp.]
MKNLMKAALLGGAAWGAVAGAAYAADAASTDQISAVDEVVVTARRREENLKDVPAAVSAYSADKLERAGGLDITSLQQLTPNTTVQVARGSNSTLISFIRGVGQQDPLWGFEPGVGLYVDDVYMARPQGAVLDIYDIQRIEVLRGPQGTLYGRNTIGGAIKYVTREIGAEPELKVKGVFGSYGQHDEIVSGKMPIFGDTLGVSAAIAKYDHDGYGHNLHTGADQYNKDVTAGRAAMEWRPTDALFFRLSGDIVRDDSNPRHGHREVPTINIGGVLVPGEGVLPNVYDTNAGAGDKNYVRSSGVSFLGQWKMNDELTFKSISAYRSGVTRGAIDFDNEPEAYLDVPARYNDHQFSQEFQLTYTGERLQGVAGVYYFNGTAAGAYDTVVSQLFGGFSIATNGYVDTRSYAVFADFSYQISDDISISLGGRWTKDEKTGHVFKQNYLGIRTPQFGNTAAVALGAPSTNFTNSRDFEKFTPRASVSYKMTPDITTYLSYSRGFKSGGFDMRADTSLTPDSRNGYAPETVTSYEAGAKGYFFDHRLMLNSAIFLSKYRDQQITLQTPVGASIASQVLNVGRSHMSGVEMEGQLTVTNWLTGNFSFGYIDAKFDEYKALDLTSLPFTVRDFSKTRFFQNTPPWTSNFSLNVHHDFGDKGALSFTPSVSYRGKFHMFEVPTQLDQNGYFLWDASLQWKSADNRYTVALIGKNLTDKRYRIGGYNFPQSLATYYGNSVTAYYGAPRTYAISLEAKF